MIKTYSRLPFFTPVIYKKNVGNENFSTLGRFAENVWNVGRKQKLVTIILLSETSNRATVKNITRKDQNILPIVLKIAALTLFFPFFLSLKCIYRCSNTFYLISMQPLQKKIDAKETSPEQKIEELPHPEVQKDLGSKGPQVGQKADDKRNNQASGEQPKKEKIEKGTSESIKNIVATPPKTSRQPPIDTQIDEEDKSDIQGDGDDDVEGADNDAEDTDNVVEGEENSDAAGTDLKENVPAEELGDGNSSDEAKETLENVAGGVHEVGQQVLTPPNYKTMDAATLFKHGEEFFANKKYSEALDCFGRYVIHINEGDNDPAIRKAFKCLIELELADEEPDLPGSRNNIFKEIYACYKENRLETDENKIKNKLATLGKISLTATTTAPRKRILSSLDMVESVAGIKIKNEKSEKSFPLAYAISATVGNKDKTDADMEDFHLATTFKIQQNGGKSLDVQLLGVFDGHSYKSHRNGRECANFFANNLSKALQEELNNKELSDLNIWNAMKQAPVKINEEWNKTKKFSGSTGCFMLVFHESNKDVIWIGNLGDSRALLGVGDKCNQLSTDARYRDEEGDSNPANKKFLTSLKSRSGTIDNGRLDGVQPLRGIGKYLNGKGHSSRPEIMPKIDTSAYTEDLRFVLASDGTWDVIGSQEAFDLIQGHSTERAANILVEESINKKSTDNNTVMVIDFKHKA